MRSITARFAAVALAVTLFAVGGCGSDRTTDVAPDLAVPSGPACPPGADALHGATCRYGVDSVCQSSLGYPCRCLCDGYWECDLVKRICDGGTAHD